jgi:hypothetical protein
MKRAAPPILAGAALLLACVPVRAQAGWTTGVALGRSVYDVPGVEPAAVSTLLSARYDARRPLWLTLDAGVPLAARSTLWGSAGAGGRLQWEAAALMPGIDAGVQLYGFRDPVLEYAGRGVVGELLPGLALARGAMSAELRSGVQIHSLAGAGVREDRAVHLTEARIGGRPFGGVNILAEARYVRATEGGYPYAGVRAARARERVEVWGRLGKWASSALPGVEWGGGVAVQLAPGVVVEAAAEQSAGDPLFLNPQRRGWSLGVRRTSHARTSSPLPVLPAASDGSVLFRLPAGRDSAAPAVAGDFNQWTPTPMQRVGREWQLRIRVAPGIYHYAFRRGDGAWFVPDSAPGRTDDGMGGTSALLVVP